MTDNQTIQERYYTWLATQVSPTQLSEFYMLYVEIEEFCLSRKIIKKKLFTITRLADIRKVMDTVESNKVFRFTYKENLNKIKSAIQFYYRFMKEHSELLDLAVIEKTSSGSAPEKEKNVTSTPIQLTHREVVSSSTLNKCINEIDFTNIHSLAFTKPVKFSYFDEVQTSINSWTQLYVQIIKSLIKDYPDILHSYINRNISGTGKCDFTNEIGKNNMKEPKKVQDNFYLETNISSTDIVKKIKKLLDRCRVNYENLKVYYQIRKSTVSPAIPTQTNTKNDNCSHTIGSANRTTCGIIEVLKRHYEYGFKCNSIRELMRFRHFADEMGVSLPEKDEELNTLILSSGTIIDGNVYYNSDDMLNELQTIVDNIFSSGEGVVYYESLFENNQKWMDSHVITSPNMLKVYLQKNITGYHYSKKFMSKGNKCSEREAVTDEIKRIWGSRPMERVHNLSERLPNIPLGNIWRVISGNNSFVWVSEGEYLFIDRFRITENEEEDILEFVDEACEEHGFASLSDVPLGSIEEENYELTQAAIYNAIYKRVLSGKYYLNEKILTKGKSDLNTVMLLKQYMHDKDDCTFNEIGTKAAELTGSINRQHVFQALYDDMVRVDKNRFVANRFVNFSIDEIDDVLAGFITDKFRAIRDITTFAMFPLCGQNWNHYLLESFCYKYSRKYSLHVIHFNDKNAGIIAEKDFNKEYNEMLAIACARADIELSPQVIGQYLFDVGYLAKSKYTKLGEIAQQALKLRKER